MPKINARTFFKRLDSDKSVPFPERAAKLMTYQAALYMVSGGRTLGELDPTEPDDDVDTEELEVYADKLRKLGIEKYAKLAYGGEKSRKLVDGVEMENPDIKALKYEYFLYQTIDLPGMVPDAMHMFALKEDLRGKLEKQESRGKVSCLDHWLSNKKEQDAAKAQELKEADRSVYEYQASDEVWREYTAAMHCCRGKGARPLTDRRVEKRRQNPYDQLTLRNKRTVEYLRRGERDKVMAARQSTERSFRFLRPQDLATAQTAAQELSRQMQNCTGEAAESREWRELKRAVFSFHTAEDPQAAAKASAQVLMAVEKFTKGKKNAAQKPEVTQCVNLALQSLGTTIPGAGRNPSVRPLVDRFNDVRRHRLQFGSMVELQDNHALSADTPDRDVLAYWQQKVERYAAEELGRDMVRQGHQPVSDEAELREHMAIALALEEAKEGRLDIKQELDSRIETLKQDPYLRNMAHKAATTTEAASELATNSKSLGFYLKVGRDMELNRQREQEEKRFSDTMKETMEDIQKQREELQRRERELRESAREKAQRFHDETARRTAKLGEELEEMGSDHYGIVAYEPEKARDLFAELLANREVLEGKDLGPDPQNALNARIKELKQDPVVQKMAETLPSDEDFRRILNRSIRKKENPAETAVEALNKAYAKGGELPRELRGNTVSDLYAPHRENVRRLAGIQPGARNYNENQATLLLASLMAIREFELKGGGDVLVDDDAYGNRVEELRKDPYLQTVGKYYLSPEHQQQIAKPINLSREPERLVASDLYKAYQKYYKKEEPVPQVQQEPKQEQPEEIRESGGPALNV